MLSPRTRPHAMLSVAHAATAVIAPTASRRKRSLVATRSPVGVSGGKPIPDASDCLDALIRAKRRQCFSQPQNVHVDGAFFDEDVSAPNAVEKLRAIEDALRPAHQLLQQSKLERPDPHASPVCRHPVRAGIHFNRTRSDLAVGRIPGPTQQGLHAGRSTPWVRRV